MIYFISRITIFSLLMVSFQLIICERTEAKPVDLHDGFFENMRKRAAQRSADRDAAAEPVRRRQLIANLEAEILHNKPLISKEEAYKAVAQALQRISITKPIEIVPLLTEFIDFQKADFFVEGRGYVKYPLESLEERYPALDALNKIGQPTIPFIIEAISEKERSDKFRSNAIHTLQILIDDRDNEATRFLLKKYRLGYLEQVRLHTYLLKELAKMEVPKIPKTLPVAAPPVEPDLEADLVKALELRDTLIGAATPPPDENQVVAAIKEAATLQTEMLLPILIDKLDFEPPVASQEDKNIFPMYAEPQGLLSPAITQAAKGAILQTGPKALPALVDAIAMRGRGSRFRANALPLIVQLAGGKTQAEKLLVQAAEDDTKKAERLREMAASLPKVR